jgi:hypothetical protein
MELIRKEDKELLRENLALKQELRKAMSRAQSAEATAAEYRRLAKSYRRRNIARYAMGKAEREKRNDLFSDIIFALRCAALLFLLLALINIIFKAVWMA